MRNVALPISFGAKRGIPPGVNATRIEIPRHAACLGMNRCRDFLQPGEDFAVFGGAEVRKHPERKKSGQTESLSCFSAEDVFYLVEQRRIALRRTIFDGQRGAELLEQA